LDSKKDAHFRFADEESCWEYIKQNLISLIYTFNQPMRSAQSLTYDQKIVVDGEAVEIGDFVESSLPEGKYEAEVTGEYYTESLNLETGRMEPRRVVAVSKHKTKNRIVKYTTSLGQKIKATDNHSFFTRKGFDIKVVDFNDNPENLIIPFNFYESRNLSVEKLVAYESFQRVSLREIVLDEDLSYFLGLMLGDGNTDGSRFQLHRKIGEKFDLEKIKNKLNVKMGFVQKPTEDSYSFYVGKGMVQSYNDTFGVGARNKRIPRRIADSKYNLHIVGGLIDSDGSIDCSKEGRNKQYVLSSASRGLLEDVQHIMLGYGYLTVIKESVRVGFGVERAIYKLFFLGSANEFIAPYVKNKVFERDCVKYNYQKLQLDFRGIYSSLKKKHVGMSKLMTEFSRRQDNLTLEDLNKYIEVEGDLGKFKYALPVRIVKTEVCENEEYVYDISVEGNENFITSSNIYAHNSPFTNVSVYDRYFLESLAKDMIFIDGSRLDIDIAQKVQKLFLEIMNEEMRRTPITFPIVTACFSRNGTVGVRDSEFLDLIARNNLEYGFINMYCGKTSTLSSCCRLRSEADNEYFNAYGSGSSKIGSLGVVTLNLPRIAYESKDETLFIERAVELAELASQINMVKRSIIRERIENGNHPLYHYGFADLNRQYSTTGLNGIAEALEILGFDVMESKGQEFLKVFLSRMNDETADHQKKYSAPHNIEMVPGESLSVKLAKKDKILGMNTKYHFYSNQLIPLSRSVNVLDRMVLQSKFDDLFSGGSIAHINLEQRIDNVETMKAIIDLAAGFGIVYWAVNYMINRCKKNHLSVGRGDVCQICGEEITDKFTRVVGFLANTKNWNETRRNYDFNSRFFYREGDLLLEMEKKEVELKEA